MCTFAAYCPSLVYQSLSVNVFFISCFLCGVWLVSYLKLYALFLFGIWFNSEGFVNNQPTYTKTLKELSTLAMRPPSGGPVPDQCKTLFWINLPLSSLCQWGFFHQLHINCLTNHHTFFSSSSVFLWHSILEKAVFLKKENCDVYGQFMKNKDMRIFFCVSGLFHCQKELCL